MASADFRGVREQILANARLILVAPNEVHQTLNGALSSTTLVASTSEAMEVVVSGQDMKFVGRVMLGLVPAIEGAEARTPEAALLKLLYAAAELVHLYAPKIFDHKRNIHGGGVFDEDLVLLSLREGSPAKRSSGN